MSRESTAALVFLLASASACTVEPREPKKPRNLILISVDTLRADHLGAYGGERQLTPNLDSLASESILFEHGYATSPFTLASVASLLSGRYPEEIGVEWNQSLLSPDVPTLAKLLNDVGWQTHAVVSNFVLRNRKTGIHTGFAHYDDSFPQREIIRGFPERDAPATTRAAIDALEVLASRSTGEPAPFFLWVHYQDPHGPYTPEESIRERFFDQARADRDRPRTLARSVSSRGVRSIPNYQYLEDHRDKEFYRAGYEGEVLTVDTAIGELLTSLRDRGLYENSLIVFTADHGESLGENEYWFAHGEFLHRELIQIPLMFHFPAARGERRSEVASLVDVLPTVLAALGLPGHKASGRDLFAEYQEHESRAIYFANLRESTTPRYGMVARGYRYLVAPRSPGEAGGPGPKREQLFRIDDPDADGDALARNEPAITSAMRAQLFRTRLEFEKLAPQKQTQELSPHERKQLEALGYVGGSGQPPSSPPHPAPTPE